MLNMTTPLKYPHYNMVSVSVSVYVCVRMPYKSNRECFAVRAACFIDLALRRVYSLPYKMAAFIPKKGLFNTVYSWVERSNYG